MNARLNQLLDRHFNAIGMGAALAKDRAELLDKTDAATYSKILTGTLQLSKARALKWAQAFEIAGSGAAAETVQELLSAAEAPGATAIEEFWKAFEATGAIKAERISELFEALTDVDSPLICVEYRDIPRAAPGAKYESLAPKLGAAITKGVSFAMFQPFWGRDKHRKDIDQGDRQSKEVRAYMDAVKDHCREAYGVFLEDVRAELKKEGRKEVEIKKALADRIRLYERSAGLGQYLGSGFQARLFFVQYKTVGADDIKIAEKRILQWVSAPSGDLLVLRDQAHLRPHALRDSFYPVVQYFDHHNKLPGDVENAEMELYKKALNKEALPQEYKAWTCFDDARKADNDV